MIGRRSTQILECVMLDMNTQADFCGVDGAHPIANHETLIPTLRRVIAWTMRNGTPMVSSLDSHRRGDLHASGHRSCCIDGSRGQAKLAFTILPSSACIEVDNTLNVPMNLFACFQQILFRMRDDDLLSNPKADRFLTQLPVREYIVYGNVMETTIKKLVLGLCARHKPVTILADACGFWDKSVSELALRQMVAKGAHVLSIDQLAGRRLAVRRRYARDESIHDTKQPNGNGRRRSGLPPLVPSLQSHLPISARPLRMPRKNGRVGPNHP